MSLRSSITDFQRQEAPSVQKKDSAWFYSELVKVSSVEEKGKDFVIVCPFHNDHTPSCYVDKNGGYFNCFSCSAGGSWNELAERLGMTKLSYKRVINPTEGMDGVKESLSRALSKAGVSVRKVHAESDAPKPKRRPLIDLWNPREDWRGLPGKMLAAEGCLSIHDVRHNVHRIGLPVRNITGGLQGYTCRAIEPKDAKPKYSPLAPDKSDRLKELPAKEALFLVDHIFKDNWQRVLLVEGPADALRLYALGVPALAILGTENWSDIKAAIIGSSGLKAVGVLMDADNSGASAQEEIIRDLSPIIKVKGFGLPKNVKDPDLLSEKQILWLKDRLFSF